MNKLTKKYHIDYLILFIILCIAFAGFVVWFIIHPRPYNLLIAVAIAFFAVSVHGFMQKSKFESPYDYEKQLRFWKRSRKAAKKKGQPFDHEKPVRPVNSAFMITPIISALLLVCIVAYLVGSILAIVFPSHAAHEYNKEMAIIKSDIGSHFYFPSELPEDAKKVKWLRYPAFGKSGGTDILIFDASDEYISEHSGMWVNGTPTSPETITNKHISKYFTDTAEVYILYYNNDEASPHREGFFSDGNRIGYFAELSKQEQ